MSTSTNLVDRSSPQATDAKKVEQAEHRSFWQGLAQLWSVVIFPFLVIRLLLVLVGLIAIYYFLPLINRAQPIYPNVRIKQFPASLWLMWNHFDSGFYLNIARGGYWGAESLKGMSNWAFFPLYPLLMRLLALPFGIQDDTLSIAGLVLANVAAVVAVIYLYKLTAKELGEKIAARTVVYLALFPMSFYLSAIYPESLFLALSIGCLYYARTRRWWWAGLLGGCAALTRPQGVLLAVVIGWEYWQYLSYCFAPVEASAGRMVRAQSWLHSRFVGFWRAFASVRSWLGLCALLLIPLGLGIFCLYARWKVGTFFPFEEVERNGWGRTFTNPVIFLWHMVRHPRETSPYDWNFYALNMIVIALFLCALIPIFWKLPKVYGLFALLFVLMPLTSGETNSIARYYMEIFPAFMVLAWWVTRGREELQARRHTLIVATFALLLSLGMAMFTLGIYSMS